MTVEVFVAASLLAAAATGAWRAVIRVADHQQVVVEVDGEFHRLLDPGTHLVRPVGREIAVYDRRIKRAETEAIVAGERRRVTVNWEITDVRALHEAGGEPEAAVDDVLQSDEVLDENTIARRVNEELRPWGTVVGVELQESRPEEESPET